MMRHRMLWLALTGGAFAGAAAVACGNTATSGTGFGNTGGATGSATGSTNGGSGGQTTGGGNAASATNRAGASGSSGGSQTGNTTGSPQTGSSGGAATGTTSGSSSGSATGSSSRANNAPDAGGVGADAGGVTVTGSAGKGTFCLKPATDDYTGGDQNNGPYQVGMQANVDLSSYLNGAASPTTYTIFYPQPFEANCPHPVVAWGNGTGVTGSQTYGYYNSNAAGYGIVVIASDNSNVGSGQYHKAGIDYMMAQNMDSSSMFYQKLSARVGTAGHSQGAMGATAATTLIGPNCQAEVSVAGGGAAEKNTAFLCLTGTMDQLESSCTASFQASGPPSFLADWDGGDHVTTETLAGYISGQAGSMQMKRFLAAWFRCFLADDPKACSMFQGGAPGNCGICNDPGWAKLQSMGL